MASRQDQAEADKICDDIETAGGLVFMAKKDIGPGEDFAERIRDALRSSEEIWLLMSPSSLTSDWVKTEWGAAWALKKHIVPILHRCRPEDLPERVSKRQCIDMYRYMDLIQKRFPKQQQPRNKEETI